MKALITGASAAAPLLLDDELDELEDELLEEELDDDELLELDEELLPEPPPPPHPENRQAMATRADQKTGRWSMAVNSFSIATTNATRQARASLLLQKAKDLQSLRAPIPAKVRRP